MIEMIELILERGFEKSETTNEYIRGNWIIRLDEDQIEIFNDPDKEKGVYYLDSIEDINIVDLLDDIDDIDVGNVA